MNFEEEDGVNDNRPLKRLHLKVALDSFLKMGLSFLKSHDKRRLGKSPCDPTTHFNLQAYAEDEFVRKAYTEMRCEMPGSPRSTFLMVFSPDGTKVASTHGNHNIYVTDLRTGKNIKTLIGHPRTPWCIAFHPISNQIIASGCLGGQVRIWDLSGGSEIWTAESQTVIASVAFHPVDRVLVIATYNELYFWDWSKPEPFLHATTSNPKEKVRYVAFDKMGHKLITGIANVPQSRWDRVRTPVAAANRSASPYRRRITPRYIGNPPSSSSVEPSSSSTSNDREPLSSVPERERRITACYRNLVHEYELLVHRYLQVYRPPVMVDRGTDPMETTENVSQATRASTFHSQEAGPSTSAQAISTDIQQSTSGTQAVLPNSYISMPTVAPSGICLLRQKSDQPFSTPSSSHQNEEAESSTTKKLQTKVTNKPSTRKEWIRSNLLNMNASTSSNMQSEETESSQLHSTDNTLNRNDVGRKSTIATQTDQANQQNKKSSNKILKLTPKGERSSSTPKKATCQLHINLSTTEPENIDLLNEPCSSGTQQNSCGRLKCLSNKEICDSVNRLPRQISFLDNAGSSSTNTSHQINIKTEQNTVKNETKLTATRNNAKSENNETYLKFKKHKRRYVIDSFSDSSSSDDGDYVKRWRCTSQSAGNLENGSTKNQSEENVETTPNAAIVENKRSHSSSNLIQRGIFEGDLRSTPSSDTNLERYPLRSFGSNVIITSAPDAVNNNTVTNLESNPRGIFSRYGNNNLRTFTCAGPVSTTNSLSQRNPLRSFRESVVITPSTSSSTNNDNSLSTDGAADSGCGAALRDPNNSSSGANVKRETVIKLNPNPNSPFLYSFRNIDVTRNPRLTSAMREAVRPPPHDFNALNTNANTMPSTDCINRRRFLHNMEIGRSLNSRIKTSKPISLHEFIKSLKYARHPNLRKCRLQNSRDRPFANSTYIPQNMPSTSTNNNTKPSTSTTNTNSNSELANITSHNAPETSSNHSSNVMDQNFFGNYQSNNVRSGSNTPVTEDSNISNTQNHPQQQTDPCHISKYRITPENANIGSCARTRETSVNDVYPRTNTEPCARTLINTNTQTTNSTVYSSSECPRRRFFSHRGSAFLPTRINYIRSQSRLRRSSSYLSPAMRNRLGSLSSLDNNRLGTNFAADEVINYSERLNSEEEPNEQSTSTSDFHPFDPTSEFSSINPENIGIGNMYSNIVLDLESSLNNARNITISNRPGETSDMLSSFSERLESIMQQSDSILRNLGQTINMLPDSEQNDSRSNRAAVRPSSSLDNEHENQPYILFDDPNFYVRQQNERANSLDRNRNSFSSRQVQSHFTDLIDNINQRCESLNAHTSITSDHTYPRNPTNIRATSPHNDSMTPLMTSLRLTVSHIQRQASLLRQQVESIEHIDRAMLEVAQLQMMRQMFEELYRFINNVATNTSRSTGVSSVRQMMAGTRISDSSPYDSPSDDNPAQNDQSTSAAVLENVPSTSTGDSNSQVNSPQLSRSRACSRKTYPPSRLLRMQRQTRRLSVINFVSRRLAFRDRLSRRFLFHRTFPNRSVPRGLSELTGASIDSFNDNTLRVISTDSLVSMTRRLENLLTEHIRMIGHPSEPEQSQNSLGRDFNEHRLTTRLNEARARINRALGHNYQSDIRCVTHGGGSRIAARHTLCLILDSLSRFCEDSSRINVSHNHRSQIRGILELALLLSDILLLHIVDMIPPPTGMNLDPERESLSARIDQMCSKMLQSRLTGQSHQLTRSLRLMRLIARYASRALGQTYAARRNAIFPTGNNYERRRELLGQINMCLRNMHRRRGIPYTPVELPPLPSTSSSTNQELPMRDWYRTINELVSRYNAVTSLPEIEMPSTSNGNSTDEIRIEPQRVRNIIAISSDDMSNSDDNEPSWYNNTTNERSVPVPLYRSNNVNLLNSEESAPISNLQNRPWNVPTVQINDVPVSEPPNSTWNSRFFVNSMHRLSENYLRTTSGLFRPRFLHPLYSGVNPFDADLDDPQREQMYDSDMIMVTPNHRIQVWDISTGIIPDINNSMKNIVVAECKIHNDASIDISSDGNILVTLLPSGGYLNVTNKLGVYSLRWETLGQCLYVTSFEHNAVSVSLSPLSRHIAVGLASRRVSLIPNDKWTMARIFLLDQSVTPFGGRLPVLREIEQTRDTNYMSLNCIRWLPVSGQGLIYATNTGQLRVLT